MNSCFLPEIWLLKEFNKVPGIIPNKGDRYRPDIDHEDNIRSASLQFFCDRANIFHCIGDMLVAVRAQILVG